MKARWTTNGMTDGHTDEIKATWTENGMTDVETKVKTDTRKCRHRAVDIEVKTYTLR